MKTSPISPTLPEQMRLDRHPWPLTLDPYLSLFSRWNLSWNSWTCFAHISIKLEDIDVSILITILVKLRNIREFLRNNKTYPILNFCLVIVSFSWKKNNPHLRLTSHNGWLLGGNIIIFYIIFSIQKLDIDNKWSFKIIFFALYFKQRKKKSPWKVGNEYHIIM